MVGGGECGPSTTPPPPPVGRGRPVIDRPRDGRRGFRDGGDDAHDRCGGEDGARGADIRLAPGAGTGSSWRAAPPFSRASRCRRRFLALEWRAWSWSVFGECVRVILVISLCGSY